MNTLKIVKKSERIFLQDGSTLLDPENFAAQSDIRTIAAHITRPGTVHQLVVGDGSKTESQKKDDAKAVAYIVDTVFRVDREKTEEFSLYRALETPELIPILAKAGAGLEIYRMLQRSTPMANDFLSQQPHLLTLLAYNGAAEAIDENLASSMIPSMGQDNALFKKRLKDFLLTPDIAEALCYGGYHGRVMFVLEYLPPADRNEILEANPHLKEVLKEKRLSPEDQERINAWSSPLGTAPAKPKKDDFKLN